MEETQKIQTKSMNNYILQLACQAGLGLYAKELIKEGTLVWKFTKTCVTGYSKEECHAYLEALATEEEKYFWASHIWCTDGKAWSHNSISIGNGDVHFWNHSNEPNDSWMLWQQMKAGCGGSE